MLYFRMLLTMLVSLFTVRVVLDTLGVVDYGIYNVVGGMAAMFSFLSGTMASASQRFFAFELGRKNYGQLKKTFSMTMTIYAMIAIIILLLSETVGLWLLNNKMTIPPERMEAARWVYQFSILSFMMAMFSVPYNAAIIAHERMKIYAYVSIVEVSLKLMIVYLLLVFPYDKLKLYAVLMFTVTTLITFVYRTYTQREFSECRYSFYWDRTLFKEIVVFSGWNIIGNMSAIFKNQGNNILLNIFFGPAVNAAQGIAMQINSAVAAFVTNFQMALNPPITKSYAANDYENTINLSFQGARFSFFLLYFLTLPILLNTKLILGLWLKEIPDYTIIFVRLILVISLCDTLYRTLITLHLSTGRIKDLQIIIGGLNLLILPVSYFFLKLGSEPQITLIITLIFSLASIYIRLYLLNKVFPISLMQYTRQVIFNISAVLLSSFPISYLIVHLFTENIPGLIISIILSSISCAAFIYMIGLTYKERIWIKSKAVKYLNKFYLA